ncbi:MAG TPA: long-chain fatty acid--CoA ligase [Actinopolymorphaceae bacterium]|jgi:acyl-CoA synthetase (AMP-forming)/AMP-acid ligase II
MYLTQSLHRSIQCLPEAPATVFGGRVRSFGELGDRVSRLAGSLRQLGIDHGERVAILSLNSDRFAEWLLAVPWAGGVVNPINVRWSTSEIVYSLDDSGTHVLFVDDTFAARVPAIREGHPDLRAVVYMGDDPAPHDMLSYEKLIRDGEPVDDARRGGDELAGLFYTGGTTGFPKGVMLSHANLLICTMGAEASSRSGAGRKHLIAVPMFHLAGISRWLNHLLLGNTQVILPAFEPVAVMQAIQEHRIGDLVLVPTMLQMIADHPELPSFDLSSVNSVVYAGSPITTSLLERAMQAFPEAEFTQFYGQTELAPITTALTAEDHREGTKLRSAGRAVVHSEVRIVDSDDNEVPRGTVGEIVSRGAHVMQGYWNRPEETAQALRNGWMHTGDAGYMDDDGYVYVVDRLKDMIITGGENVYSAEVENALADHPAIDSVAVIAVPDPDWGERVHAVVVCKPGHSIDLEQIREHCRKSIAPYKAPRSCEVVDALPLSPAGKVLKHELRKPYWEASGRQVH